jgi:hypothetical protein
MFPIHLVPTQTESFAIGPPSRLHEQDNANAKMRRCLAQDAVLLVQREHLFGRPFAQFVEMLHGARFLDERRSFAVEDIRVDTQLLDEAKAAGYSTKVLFISTEDPNLNVGRVLVRMSRGGQAVPVSSVIDSYRESTKNLSEVPKHADELLVYDNTAHRRGFRVAAHFIGGKLSKTAQTIPDWAAKVFGKELRSAKQHEKPGRGR